MLQLNQLTQFLSIARTGSLAAAAVELNVSPAALSKSLASLEKQLGARLFDRVGRGLKLTPAGEIFSGETAELLGHADAVAARFQNTVGGSAGRVTIGCGPLALQGPITEIAHRFASGEHDVALEIETGYTRNLIQGLRQYRYDFLVTDAGDLTSHRNFDDYLVRHLPGEGVVAVASRTHPLAGRRRVTLSDALAYPWITPSPPHLMRRVLAQQLRAEDAPRQAFARLAAIPDVRIEDMNSCMQIAAGSECLATTLASKARSEGFPRSLKVLPVTLNVSSSIAIITLKQRTPSPLAARIMAALAELQAVVA